MASTRSTDLADRAASLAGELLPPGSSVAVVLHDPEGRAVIGQSGAAQDLAEWASACLRSGAELGSKTEPYLAQAIRSAESLDPHGFVAARASGSGSEAGRALAAVAELTRIRAAQIDESRQARAGVEGTRLALRKGLHDLRTPLNSLRLGLHLLEPAMTDKDPALMQRTQRAVDRMAALVTEMFDLLTGDSSEDLSEAGPVSRDTARMSAAQ